MSTKKTFITASQLIRSAGCLHAYYLELFGESSQRKSESDAEKLVRKEGLGFQEIAAQKLGLRLEASRTEPSSLEERYAETLNKMRSGEILIYQGVLIREHLIGIPDILMKIPGTSLLGDYKYLPMEIKNRAHLTQSDRLQLSFYSYLLEPILGERPDEGAFFSSELMVENIYLPPKLERQISEILRNMEFVRKGVTTTKPLRCSSCARCSWLNRCAAEWKNSDHISLISGMSSIMVRKLEEAGLTSCRELAQTEAEQISKLIKVSVSTSVRFIYAAKARSLDSPILLKKVRFPETRPIFFYDIETCDETVFSHAILRMEHDQLEERCFFAEDPLDEEKVWHQLLDYMDQPGSPMVFCWTFYERYYMKRLWQKYRGNERGYENLSTSLVDQCAFVREHFALPCRGYSIKSVAPYFGFEWQSENSDGLNCIAWYRLWIRERDLSVKKKIMEYNLDDVRAMKVIDQSLKDFCLSLKEGAEH